MVCKKTRRLRGRMADICKHEPALLKEISRGVQLGTKECQFQFRNRRWNCTTSRRSLKKVLTRGKNGLKTCLYVFYKLEPLVDRGVQVGGQRIPVPVPRPSLELFPFAA